MRKKTYQGTSDRFAQGSAKIWRSLLNMATLCFLTLLLSYVLLPKLGFPLETVLTGSMEPAIGTEDLLLIDTYSRKPEPGDIVVFEQAGRRIIHRVTERTETGYRTKGDANPDPDSLLVQPEQMKGRCIAVFKNGKRFTDFLHSPMFLAVAAGLFLLQGIGSRRSEKQRPFEKS